MTPRSASEWLALAPTVVGIVGLLGLASVWVITGRESALLVTAFGSLLVGGQGAQALAALRRPPPPPPEENEWDPS